MSVVEWLEWVNNLKFLQMCIKVNANYEYCVRNLTTGFSETENNHINEVSNKGSDTMDQNLSLQE